jgi:hypothetical protein
MLQGDFCEDKLCFGAGEDDIEGTLVRVSRAGLRRGRRRGDETRPGLTHTEINSMSLRPPTLPSSRSWRRPHRAAPATLSGSSARHAVASRQLSAV